MLCNSMLFIVKRAFPSLPNLSPAFFCIRIEYKALRNVVCLCMRQCVCDRVPCLAVFSNSAWIIGFVRVPVVFHPSFPPSFPCLAVFISGVCVLHFHSSHCPHHRHYLQSSLRIPGPKMYPSSSMDMAKSLIVVS